MKEYARNVVIQPAVDYYVTQFNENTGESYKFKKCLEACKMFDPFYLKNVSISTLELLVDNLIYFEYEEFDEKFLQMMKSELRDAVQHTYKAFDWDAISSGKNYQQRSIKRNQRRDK